MSQHGTNQRSWRLPDYSRGLAHVLPAALASVAADDNGDQLFGFGRARAAIVLLVDGLGARQLEQHRDLAPTLFNAPGETIDVGFPSTTVTSLASMTTGVSAGQHGLVGTSVAREDDHRPLNLLVWGFGRQNAAERAVDRVHPETFQPYPTVFGQAADHGVEAVTVLKPEFVGSGLTRAVFRGGKTLEESGLPATLDTAREVVTDTTRNQLVYCYHPDLDAIGHGIGPHTDRWCSELATLDACVADLVRRLPSDVVLAVTSDHGMLAIPGDSLIELAGSKLMDGVRVLAGEPRARQLAVDPGALDDVRATWGETLGDDYLVADRDETVADGWFGPKVDAEVAERIGDLVVVPTDICGGLVHRELDAFGGRLAGMHAALTPAELEVPLRILRHADVT